MKLDAECVRILQGMSPDAFVLYVREIKRLGMISELCDLVGAKHGAGISQSRQIGNLCVAIHGENKRNEYLSAFYEQVTTIPGCQVVCEHNPTS